MAKTLQIQSNFTAGELSPRLWAHVDMAKYKNGVKTATNCTVLPHGPLKRRNGFQYIAESKTSSLTSRLLRFQFDQDNAYILEFGNLYIRVYTEGGQVQDGGSPYEITTTYTTAELFEITYVQFGRILYLFHGSHPPAQLTWTSDTSWALADVQFYPTATSEEGWKPPTTMTPAATTGTGVNFVAGSFPVFMAADIGRQIHNLAGAGKAAITSIASSQTAVCTIIEAFPDTSAIASQSWKIDLSPITEVTPSGAQEGSVINLTAAANAWISSGRDLNQYVLINNGTTKILSVTSATVAVAEVQKALDAVTASSTWTHEENIWSATFGYPRTCALHQQRLFGGGTSNDPQTIWGSESGIFNSMGIGSRDGDAVSFELSGKEVNRISWMADLRGNLVIGTTGAEVTIDAGGSGPLTPSNIVQQVRGFKGSNLQQPIGLDDQVIYVQRSGRKINAFRYDFQLDNYVSEDLLFMAQHMPTDGIKEIAYAQDPDRTLFAVLNNGDMLACTYIREQEVIAWTRWVTDGSFESVNTISTGANDEVWVVVKRTINGTTKRYIERLDVSEGEDNLDGFSDSYLTYSAPKTVTAITKANPGVVTANSHGFSNGDYVKLIDVGGMIEVIGKTYIVANQTTNTFELTTEAGNVDTTAFTTYTSGGSVYKLVTTISGLSHLEGETVQVKVDGATHGDKTVSGGAITLDRRGYEVTVGLPYTTTIVTLPKEYNAGEGSQQGQQARWIKPILRFYKSSLPTLDGESVAARSPQDLMDKKLDLFSGDIRYGHLTWKDGFTSNLTIQTSNPLPMVLLGIFGSVEGGSQ